MFEQIKDRYDKGYVTQAQLEKFVALGAITEDEAQQILGNGGGGGGSVPAEGMIATAELDAAYKEGVNSYV